MAVLITGSAGLVGHAVRRRLEADGVPVVPVDRDARSYDGVDQVPCDITDRAAVAVLFREHRVTAVVHCGGVSGPMVSPDDPLGIVDANVGGTAVLLDAARGHRVSRFVSCSSIAAYGRTPPGPVPESAPLRPLDVYGATKACGEHLVSAYRAEHGVPGVSLRLSTVFGPRRRSDCLIRTLLLDAAAGRRTRVPVAADAPQQYVHVDDAAAAVVGALRAPHVGDAYNVTGGTLLTVEEVVGIVRRVDPRVEVEQAAADPAGAARWPGRLDISAAARDLGYRPDGDLAAAVADYRTWLDSRPS